MRERLDILRDPPEELNPELYKPHFDWEEEERILAEKEKQERRKKLKNFLRAGNVRFKSLPSWARGLKYYLPA